jgi:isopentenyldiphosphate isomerase
MEYVDVLTADGRTTGKRVLRSVAHSQGLWHRTVHVWVRNRSKELLFQQRSQSKETFPGQWDISAAGHISAGDASREAAVREMKEELGVSIDDAALRFLFTIRHSYLSPDSSFKDNEISDVYLCTTPVEDDELTLDPKEVMGAAFYPIAYVKKLLAEKSVLFVPHEEEYGRLFEVLDALM